MVRGLGDALAAWTRRWVPDPFIFAILLTALAFGLASLFGKEGFSVIDTIGAWGGRLKDGEVTPDEQGIWKFLAFSMQMCLILVTGHALAATRWVGGWIRRVASLPKTTAGAAALTAFVAMAAAWINWGLGLIVGALLAREIGRVARADGRLLHYPLVVAAGYVGLMVWHGGLSGTAPFKMTQLKDVAEVLGDRAQQVGEVPLNETVFSPLNLVVTALVLIVVPLLFMMLAPRKNDPHEGAPALPATQPEPESRDTPADRMNHSLLLTLFVVAIGAAYLFLLVPRVGVFSIDINIVILFFLLLGLALHGSPLRYVNAISEAAGGCGGIILQFPFYAGIQAVLSASGIIALVSNWMAENATAQTLPVYTFLTAAVVNLFVPSGGGQWAVQGPIVVETALQLGSPVGANVMALAYGDQWTNMLQPFWALPLLSLTGLRARDIIGYTAAVMLLSAPLFILPLIFLH
jgi:short-chain fatty acids transporter